MKLFAFADSDFRHLTSRQHCLSQICDLERRNLGDESLTTLGLFQSLDHQFHTLLQTDPETGHAIVGDGELGTAVLDNVVEERNNRSTASGHITVTNEQISLLPA